MIGTAMTAMPFLRAVSPGGHEGKATGGLPHSPWTRRRSPSDGGTPPFDRSGSRCRITAKMCIRDSNNTSPVVEETITVDLTPDALDPLRDLSLIHI